MSHRNRSALAFGLAVLVTIAVYVFSRLGPPRPPVIGAAQTNESAKGTSSQSHRPNEVAEAPEGDIQPIPPGDDWLNNMRKVPEQAKRAIAQFERAGVRVLLYQHQDNHEEEQDERADDAEDNDGEDNGAGQEEREEEVGQADTTGEPIRVTFRMSGAADASGFEARFTHDALAGLLRSLPNVYDIDMARTNVTDDHLKALHESPGLMILHLDNTPITDNGIAHLAPLTEIDTLYLSFTKIDDEALSQLNPMRKLRSLWLDGTSITDAGLKELDALDALRELSIARTNITDAGLAHLRGLPLQFAWLNGTDITDDGLVNFRKGMTHLRHLDLTDTKVTEAGVDQLRHDVPRLQHQKSGDTTYVRISAGITVADNPATVAPATQDQIARLEEVLWWLPVRSACVLVSHGPFKRFFGPRTAGEERAFEAESTMSVFNDYMRVPLVVSDDLDQVPLALVVEAWVGRSLCHICLFEEPVGEHGDAFMASLAARGGREEAIGETKVVCVETDFDTGAPWITLAARPRRDVVLLATDREYLADLLGRMKTRGARRALPDDLPEWKHLDISARQWVMAHYTKADSPFMGGVYSLRAGSVAKVLFLCRDKPSAAVARRWWPCVESGLGHHQEIREIGGDLIEMSFSVNKKLPLGDFIMGLHGPLGLYWQEQTAEPEGAAPLEGDPARGDDK